LGVPFVTNNVTDQVFSLHVRARRGGDDLGVSLDVCPPPANVPVLDVQLARADLGFLQQGQEYTAEFQLTNLAKTSLMVRRVELSCACTDYSLGQTELAAGESVPLRLRWSTGTTRGLTENYVDVSYTCGEGPLERCSLTFGGTVIPNIAVVPDVVAFASDAPRSALLRLTPKAVSRLAIRDLACSHPCLKAKCTPRVSDSEPVDIQVEFDPNLLSSVPCAAPRRAA
jgi:hypothetical protein